MAHHDHKVSMSSPLRKKIEDLLWQGSSHLDNENEETTVMLKGMSVVSILN